MLELGRVLLNRHITLDQFQKCLSITGKCFSKNFTLKVIYVTLLISSSPSVAFSDSYQSATVYINWKVSIRCFS